MSDQIGRENDDGARLQPGAGAYWALGTLGNTPWMFVVCAGLVFFTWGEIFSLFPSTCTDTFGSKYATTNAGLLYTAKGTSASWCRWRACCRSQTGGWHAVFVVAAITNLAVAALAFFVLKPMRRTLSQE